MLFLKSHFRLQFLRRLSSDSMTDTVEDQLLTMKSHLIKIKKYRSCAESKLGKTSTDGKLELNTMKDKAKHHIMVLYPDTKGDLGGTTPFKRFDRRMMDSGTTHASMNQEWRTMFAATQDSIHVSSHSTNSIRNSIMFDSSARNRKNS